MKILRHQKARDGFTTKGGTILVSVPMPQQLHAVIFDLGGVVLDSPLPAIAAYEADLGLPRQLIARLVTEGGTDGAWARLERGELTASAFATTFSEGAGRAGYAVDGAELLARIEEATTPRPSMLNALRNLRSRGLKVAALTNAWDMPGRTDRMDQLRPLFDAFVESFHIGMRKPELRIYEFVCRTLGITPAGAVFLDDLGSNLKPARTMGMTTIKVTDPDTALSELDSLLR